MSGTHSGVSHLYDKKNIQINLQSCKWLTDLSWTLEWDVPGLDLLAEARETGWMAAELVHVPVLCLGNGKAADAEFILVLFI